MKGGGGGSKSSSLIDFLLYDFPLLLSREFSMNILSICFVRSACVLELQVRKKEKNPTYPQNCLLPSVLPICPTDSIWTFFFFFFLANMTLCFNYYYRIKRQCITFVFFPDYWIFCYRYIKWRTILFLFSADETHRIVCTNVYLRCMMYECRSLAFDNNCWWTSHLFFVNLPSRDIVQPWHTRSGSVNTETEIVVSSTCRRRRNNKSLFFLYILQRSL